MSLSPIILSIVIQSAVFLVVHACLFFPGIDPVNYLYIGTIVDFFVELPIRILWVVAFHKWFPGQVPVYLAASILLVILLLKARKESLSWKALSLYHLVSLVWIFLPVLLLKFGTYRGP